MFRNLFRKKKKRDLFEELSNLTKEKKQQLEEELAGIQKAMVDAGGLGRECKSQIIKFEALNFDSLGWTEDPEIEQGKLYYNEFGDFMTLDKLPCNGKMERGQASQLETYRHWIRERCVAMDGGVISCEEYMDDAGLEAFESITKVPRGKDATGIDYIYFLNIRNYEEQSLYQIHVKVHEKGITGIRDNLFMSPIANVLQIDIGELAKNYRKDPYDATFQAGNTMNLTEMDIFDHLIPFHPLSIIRNEIRPRILKSVSF